MQHVRAPFTKQPRRAGKKDLLSLAHGSELDWCRVGPLLRGQTPGRMTFVYFIGEVDDGPVKIGQALDPIKRLRGLQVGNPRRLRIERLIYGDVTVEKLMHEYFKEAVIGGKAQESTIYHAPRIKGTEWFDASARDRIFTAADVILRHQRAAPWGEDGGITVEALCEAVGEAMTELGYELRRQEETLLLAAHGVGYAVVKA